ncbi:MAG TPA: NAD(P)/FAD-dependent oxidoreductase [Mycobacteriales bacterium]
MTVASPQDTEHLDVLIVGAGLSGIGAAHTISTEFPQRSYAILEARDAIGGTWDLFRYPGVRSDSDMHTLGYRFRPWRQARAIADGPAILDYVRDTAREDGTDAHIRYHHKVVHASWSTPDARWTVEALRTDTGETVRLTASFLFLCPGYYNYDKGYTPQFPGIDDFAGVVVHPQFWPEDLDYSGKKVVVIGSGATAVTLVPALTDRAEHVTMLQRSPTYIAALPGEDPIAKALRKVLPDRLAFPLVRWKNILLFILNYQVSRRRPELMKTLLRKGQERMLPPGYDIDTHFTPSYNPWDQRLCVVPDGDLFKAISAGSAEIVTDHIETFTRTGLRLTSGRELDADVVVTATGLEMQLLGGMGLTVDGEEMDITASLAYRAAMLSGIPNAAFVIGYTNASWTLKADLVGQFVGRLLAYMDEHGYTKVVPENTDPTVREVPLMDFQAGYVLRALDRMPKAGNKAPWLLKQNYALDLIPLRYGKIDDGVLRFSTPVGEPVAAAPATAAS